MLFKRNGFTLVELLIVVAIIGIIVGVAVPSVLSALKRSKLTRTKADLKVIATELDTYYSDHGRYPSMLIDASPERKDMWGEPFEYEPFDGSAFCVCSGGTNKIVDQNCADIADDNFVWKHGCDLCRIKGIDKDAFWGNCAVVAPH